MSEIIANKLYLGDGALVKWNNKLIEWKITDIINVANDIVHSPATKQRWKDELKIEAWDFPMQDSCENGLLKSVPQVAQLIDLLLSSGQVIYIHCVAGINRSAAVVVGYLILYQNMSYEEAYQFVSEKRPGILRNKCFRQDLEKLYQEKINSNI